MSITITSPVNRQGFLKNAVSADASGCEIVVPFVAAKTIKLRSITIYSEDAISITIGDGETAGAVTTALIGPISMGAASFVQFTFNPPLQCTEATDLTVDASGAGNICIIAQGDIT